jgi:hypothetical protein
MPTPKQKRPARRKRTSDPNLEPGLAAATRRAQRTPAVKPLSSKAALAKRSAAAKRKRTADAAKTVAKRPYSRRSGMTPETDAAIQRRPVTKKSTSPQGGAAGITRGRALGAKSSPPRAELKSLQKQMKKMMDAMRPFAATPTRQQQKKAPARTSDPNLEPGVASATRRSKPPAKKRVSPLRAPLTKSETSKIASRKAERVSPPKKRAPARPRKRLK